MRSFLQDCLPSDWPSCTKRRLKELLGHVASSKIKISLDLRHNLSVKLLLGCGPCGGGHFKPAARKAAA
jgi:hypothetical protein